MKRDKIGNIEKTDEAAIIVSSDEKLQDFVLTLEEILHEEFWWDSFDFKKLHQSLIEKSMVTYTGPRKEVSNINDKNVQTETTEEEVTPTEETQTEPVLSEEETPETDTEEVSEETTETETPVTAE